MEMVNSVVEVHLWGQQIGSVALDPTYGYYVFEYTPEFAAKGLELAPLHMPVSTAETFMFKDLPKATYRSLPALISDALPDDFGNALIEIYMAAQGVTTKEVTELDRLAFMGERGMGALTFKPSSGPFKHTPTTIELSSLVVQARQALTDAMTDDKHAVEKLQDLLDVGTSAGGARAKAVIALNSETGEIRSGQMDAPDGFEHWLIKFDGMGVDEELGTTQHYGRVEFAYFLMASAAGINMTECRLLEENGRAHFITKRFDRYGQSGRHHIQTLCSMAHVDYKMKGTNAYAQLFATIGQLHLPYEDLEYAFRRMVFNVMGRNCDDHSKNFSFLLRQGSAAWELAPAYDVTFAHNPRGEWTHQHLMSINGKFKDIEVTDLLAEAERFGVGTAKRVIEEVSAAILRWPEFAQQADIPKVQAAEIQGLLLPLN
jgi:serine/threonine-protein kinase HipA